MLREDLIMLRANSQGADQPAHTHSLFSAVVVQSLESIIV